MSLASFVIPGEFEPHAAIWLAWPCRQWFKDPLLDTRRVIAQIAVTLSDYRITTNILCSGERGIRRARDWMRRNNFPISGQMNFLPIPQFDIWVRDFGPIFLKDRSTNRLAIASFRQNQWGYASTADPLSIQMSELPGLVAGFLGIKTILSTTVVSEGGGRIQNGRGVLLLNRELEFQRNPEATQEELEAAYRATLGITRFIWLNAGLREDLPTDCGPVPYTNTEGKVIHLYGPQTTGGHLDELCSFANPNRIVLAQVSAQEAADDPIAAVNRARLEDACRILSAASDADGKPFEIVRLPVPPLSYRLIQPGEPMYYGFLAARDYPRDAPRFPNGRPVYIVKVSSYANYLVSNGLVIAPRYGNQSRDEAAAAVLKTAYPGRDVVQIDPTPLNYAGGGIHCVTQQQPLGVC